MRERSVEFIFVTDHHHLPDRVGGRESSTHDLANALVAAGHRVTVVARSSGRPEIAAAVQQEFRPAYGIIRCGDVEARAEQLLAAAPDAVAVLSGQRAAQSLSSRPSLRRRQAIYVRDTLEVARWTEKTFEAGQVLIANSAFVAGRIHDATGVEAAVIRPLVDLDRVRTRRDPRSIVFVNPVEEKGFDLLLQIAALMPDRTFEVFEAWPLSDARWSAVEESTAGLPNVVLRRAQLDPRRLYERAEALIVPSRWEEGFGRVVVEAQANGVPVFASAVGGLPEAVGEGGILLEAGAPAEAWVAAIGAVLEDDDAVARLSAAALANAARLEAEGRNAVARLVAACAVPEAREAAMALPKGEGEVYGFVLLPGGDPAPTLETIATMAGQTDRPRRILVVEGRDGLPDLPAVAEGVEVIGCRRLAGESLLGLVVRASGTPFAVLAEAGDLFEPGYAAAMLRAHLNPLRTVSVATCGYGLYRPATGPVAVRWGTPHAPEVGQPEGDMLYDISLHEPAWQLEVATPTGHAAMYRVDALGLIAAEPDEDPRALKAYGRIGAHLVGDGVHVDRTLAWVVAPPATGPGGRLLLAQHQKPLEPAHPSHKGHALAAMLRNGALQLARPRDMALMLKAHFTPAEILSAAETEPELAELLLSVVGD